MVFWLVKALRFTLIIGAYRYSSGAGLDRVYSKAVKGHNRRRSSIHPQFQNRADSSPIRLLQAQSIESELHIPCTCRVIYLPPSKWHHDGGVGEVKGRWTRCILGATFPRLDTGGPKPDKFTNNARHRQQQAVLVRKEAKVREL